jgi:GAF domain-containing protein
VICSVFNTGQAKHFRKAQSEDFREELGDYIKINEKLHQVIRNVLFVPIKLGNHAIGCLEVANKKGSQDFTTNDFTIVSQLCEEIASGLIAHEMKHNIKKEFDDELKYFKGLMNQSYNTLLVPMLSEVSSVVATVLKAEK